MMVGVASQVEMRAHHIQIWPPSCRSTPLERPGGALHYVIDKFSLRKSWDGGGGGGGGGIYLDGRAIKH